MISYSRMTKAELIARLEDLEAELSGGAVSPVRKRIEDELRESEERFRMIVESVPNGIIMVNDRGEIILVNHEAENLFGYGREELLGSSIEMLVPERQRSLHASYRGGLRSHFRNREMGAGRDLQARRKDGSLFPVEIGLTSIKTREGIAFISVIVDIAQRKQLEDQLLEISESERRKIGRDLHDDLCQQLVSIGFLAKALEQKLPPASENTAEGLAEIREMVRRANAHARAIARGLFPSVLETAGLTGALEQLAGSTAELFGVSCDFICRNPVTIEDQKKSVHLYRIVQEAINNAVRHGRARRIAIKLDVTGTILTLAVEDDGIGISEVEERDSGLGLLTMNQRAGMLGGDLYVSRLDKGGTAVVCACPVP